MSLIDDLRAVSENAVEQLATRFSDLPRPLLVAIGAGDMAVARFADLRESLAEVLGDRVGAPSVDLPDVRAAVADLPGRAQKVAADLPGRAQKVAADLPGRAQKVAADLPGRAQKVAADLPGRAQKVAADLPGRAQKVAADVATSIEHFAAEAPGRAQELIAQLPDKLAEVQIAAQSLSPDQVRETMDAYAQLAGMIFGSLADRGTRTWTKVRSGGLRPGAVVDSAAGAPSTAAERAAAAAAARASADAARAAADAARAAAAVRAATQDPSANAEPDTAEPLEVAQSEVSQSEVPQSEVPQSEVTRPDASKAEVRQSKARAPRKAPPTNQSPATTTGARRTTQRTPRNSPHQVTTPDGEAEVTVAPADVIPKGARVKPAAQAPTAAGRPAPITPAADVTDEPIGI